MFLSNSIVEWWVVYSDCWSTTIFGREMTNYLLFDYFYFYVNSIKITIRSCVSRVFNVLRTAQLLIINSCTINAIADLALHVLRSPVLNVIEDAEICPSPVYWAPGDVSPFFVVNHTDKAPDPARWKLVLSRLFSESYVTRGTRFLLSFLVSVHSRSGFILLFDTF